MEKNEILKDNLDKAIARSKNNYAMEHRRKMSKDQQRVEKKMFRSAAIETEKKLPYLFNQEKDNTPDDFKRPELGRWFGGVSFDKKEK